MKRLILASVSAIALGLGGAGVAYAQGYPGSTTGPNAQTYYPNFSSSSSYTNSPRYIPGNTAAIGNTAVTGGGYAFLTHAQVRQAQRELARAGDYTGPINSTLDPATSEALADWQGQHNLPATGGFNPQTMASLGLSTAPPYYYVAGNYGYGAPYAYQGSSYQGAMAPSWSGGTVSPNTRAYYGYSGNSAANFGNTTGGAFAFLTHAQVRQAQRELARAGDYTGPINGVLDPATSYALIRYQSQHNLPATGGFNPQIMASLGLSTAPPYYYAANYSGAPHVYQGSSAPRAAAPSGAGGTMAPNTPVHHRLNGTAGQGASAPRAAAPSGAGGTMAPNTPVHHRLNGTAGQGASAPGAAAPSGAGGTMAPNTPAHHQGLNGGTAGQGANSQGAGMPSGSSR